VVSDVGLGGAITRGRLPGDTHLGRDVSDRLIRRDSLDQ